MDLVEMEPCEHDNEGNFTSAELNFTVDNAGSGIPLKIIAVLIYLFGSMGNFLYLGVIHYEKFGHDAQKRSFPDRIFSFNCLVGFVGSFIYFTISIIRWIFGPVYYTITTLRYYCISVMLCVPLGKDHSLLKSLCLKIKICSIMSASIYLILYSRIHRECCISMLHDLLLEKMCINR